ncbi:antitoxin [Streptomyces sp. NPDC014995]|uniref:antitoxin n=1 Tax=Streptomyces sp. NPDC014995 TaxID=3364936 RepID=UPI0036FF8842
MGIFDRFRHQGRDKAKHMSDAAEKKANERTGNKYESQVDSAQQQAERRLGMDEDRPDRPEQQP